MATRDVLLKAVTDCPGLSRSEIARMVGISRSLANFHCRRLARGGFLLELRTRREIHVFPAGWTSTAMAAHQATSKLHARPILEELRRQPAQSVTELHRRLGIRRKSLAKAARSLQIVGLIVVVDGCIRLPNESA